GDLERVACVVGAVYGRQTFADPRFSWAGASSVSGLYPKIVPNLYPGCCSSQHTTIRLSKRRISGALSVAQLRQADIPFCRRGGAPFFRYASAPGCFDVTPERRCSESQTALVN